ncbi:MAG TPA: peptidylprolyl isomerase [Dehalococcoidia bacterium]|nr:peptidylprolyl isomerase [Dehalococcoidia bacterium]
MDEDRRNTLLLYALIGGVVAFALIIIAYGYYQDRIAPKHETVLTVGDKKFDFAFLERRVRSDLNLGLASSNATLQQVVVTAVQNIESEEMARRAAKEAGIHITDADIDAYIRRRLGLKDDTPREVFAAAYRRDVLKSGLPVKEYRDMFAALVAEQRFVEQFKATVPASDEQADTLMIKTADEAKAREAKSRIDAGDGFNVIAATYSIDDSKEAGGELGWVTRNQVSPKVADVLFTLPLGKVSEPIQDSTGWYLLMVRAREVRDIDDPQKALIAQAMYRNRIEETRERVGSSSRLTEEQIVRIGRSLLGG